MADRETIRKIGAFLVVISVVSAVVSLGGYELTLLAWLDQAGPTGGWVVRAMLFAGGFLLYRAGQRSSRETRELPAPGMRAQIAGADCEACKKRIERLLAGTLCKVCRRPVHIDCADLHERSCKGTGRARR